jgi:hypothetical protein
MLKHPLAREMLSSPSAPAVEASDQGRSCFATRFSTKQMMPPLVSEKDRLIRIASIYALHPFSMARPLIAERSVETDVWREEMNEPTAVAVQPGHQDSDPLGLGHIGRRRKANAVSAHIFSL